MATLTSGQRQEVGALTAATVTTVTFPGYIGKVRVTNLDGAAEITVKVGNTAVTLADPTAGDATGFTLPAAVGSVVLAVPRSRSVTTQALAPAVVKLISASTPRYKVEEE